MKKEFPELFNQEKDLDKLNTKAEEDDPNYWRRTKSEEIPFSREPEMMEKLEEAIRKDIEMQEVPNAFVNNLLILFLRERGSK